MQETLVTIPAVAVLLVEGFKWVFKRYMITDPYFEIPAQWYLIILPVAEVIAATVLVVSGFMPEIPEYMDVSSIPAVFGTILHVVVQALVSMFLYNGSVQKLKSTYQWQQTTNALEGINITTIVPTVEVELPEGVADDGEGLG